jgi:hypothetical protein
MTSSIRNLARERCRPVRALLAAAAAAFALLATGHALAQIRSAFDHVRTGFPLTGAHQVARCESCHMRGIFKGTPRQCAACHTAGSNLSTVTMPAKHLPVTQPCDACHTSNSFAGARFTHVGIQPGTCTTCHNGMTAAGKPPGHVVTTASCDTCHRVSTYKPALRFDHSRVAPGSCATCHNGTSATGKPAKHIPTTAACDTCHRTTAWLPVTFSHAGVAPGTCATCHNGTSARGKPANHVPTTAACDTCHRTTAWLPAMFNHAGVAPGTCATCHNGTSARGQPANHFLTTRACDACHTTTAWLPVRPYTHLSPFYRPHNSSVTCLSCHKSNSEVATWTFAAYKPDCAGCHAAHYKPGPHKKVDTPRVLYTVAELKDCAGSCHVYTDSTLTTILKAKTGKHRSTDGGF